MRGSRGAEAEADSKGRVRGPGTHPTNLKKACLWSSVRVMVLSASSVARVTLSSSSAVEAGKGCIVWRWVGGGRARACKLRHGLQETRMG